MIDRKESVKNAVLSVRKEDIVRKEKHGYPLSVKPVEECKPKQIQNALHTFATDCALQDAVVLADETFWGNGKKGFLFAKDGFYAHKGALTSKEMGNTGISYPILYDKLESVSLNDEDSSYIMICYKDGRRVNAYADTAACYLASALGAVLGIIGKEKKAAPDMSVKEMIRQAMGYEKKGNLEEAFWWYGKAAEKGDAEILFLCAAKCQKIPSDDAQKKVMEWCQKSAMLDYVNAQTTLAYIYARGGKGIQKNVLRALFWAEQAKNNGSKEGEKLYTKMLSEVPPDKHDFDSTDLTIGFYQRDPLREERDKDERKLKEIRRKSAQQGNVASQYLYGCMLDGAARTKEEKRDAAYWYETAAKDGHGDAQFQLARMYDEGDGVKKDRKTALYWYKKAAEQNIDKAQARYDSLMQENIPDAQAYVGSPKILVCGEAIFKRALIKTALENEGFQTVREAADRGKLMEEFENEKPDLAFIFARFGNYGEMEAALKEINSRWAETKIILVFPDDLLSYAESLQQKYSIVADKLKEPFTSGVLVKHTLKILGVK